MVLHAMIDLETLDTKTSSQILSLGAVKFNALSNEEPYSDLSSIELDGLIKILKMQ